jgi:hypothetical protein
MKKTLGFISIILIFTFMLSSYVFANGNISEKRDNFYIQSISITLTPKTQRVEGSQLAEWTIYATTNAGNVPITYTLEPGDGKKYTTISRSLTAKFGHIYIPPSDVFLKTFNVHARAVYDYGIDDDYATVTWVR